MVMKIVWVSLKEPSIMGNERGHEPLDIQVNIGDWGQSKNEIMYGISFLY